MLLGFVPARGGSRGLPGKNLAEVGGRSLVARAVDVARAVPAIDEVVVSSDDADILGEARRRGATPAERRADLARDDTTTIAVLREYLLRRDDVDTIVLLQPTSPLREPEDVEACLAAYRPPQSVVSVVELEHPVQWTFHLREGQLEPVLGWEHVVGRRQDADRAFTVNGAVYVADAQHLREGAALLEPGTVAVAMPRERSVDVDDALGLLVCKAIHASRAA